MNRRWLIVILLFAAAVRVQLFCAALSDEWVLCTQDSHGYLDLANGILVSSSFRQVSISGWTGDDEIFRTPGYPVMLAASEAVGGLVNNSSYPGYIQCWTMRAAIVTEIAIDVLLVALICKLGTLLVSPRVGLTAGFLQAISPLAVGASCRILSDSLYAFVFTSAVFFLIAYLRGGRWRALVASAIVLAAACYVRPIGLAMAPLFALAFLFRRPNRGGRSVAWGKVAAATAAPGDAAQSNPSPTEREVSCDGDDTGRPSGAADEKDALPGAALADTPSRRRFGVLRSLAPGYTPSAPFGAETRRTLAENTFLASSRPATFAARLLRSAAFAALFAACIAPWVIRNGVQADYWGFSSVFGDTLYDFAAPEVLIQTEHFSPDMGRRGPGYDRDQAVVAAFWELSVTCGKPEQTSGLSPGELARRHKDRAMQVICDHPGIYAKLHAKGCLAFWLPGATDVLEVAGVTQGNKGTLAVLHEKGLWEAARSYFGDDWRAAALAVPIFLFTLMQYLACLRGVVYGLRRTRWRPPAEAWLLFLVVLVSCLSAGTTGVPRFRVPVEPIINIAAAVGIVSLFGGARAKVRGKR